MSLLDFLNICVNYELVSIDLFFPSLCLYFPGFYMPENLCFE